MFVVISTTEPVIEIRVMGYVDGSKAGLATIEWVIAVSVPFSTTEPVIESGLMAGWLCSWSSKWMSHHSTGDDSV